MKSLFDQTTYTEVLNRLSKIDPKQKPLWGKMNAGQMLAHCKEAFKVPLSEKKLPRMFLGILVGWMVKSKLYNDSPWKHNLPTAPNFIIKDERNAEKEKTELIALINRFYKAGPHGISKFPHPMFGTFTPDQWGMSMYKHIDHHLRQFGV